MSEGFSVGESENHKCIHLGIASFASVKKNNCSSFLKEGFCLLYMLRNILQRVTKQCLEKGMEESTVMET